MKIRFFSTLVSILVLSTASSFADYIINVPAGYSTIANQLDNGDNTLNTVIAASLPNNSQILKWDCGAGYVISTRRFNGWSLNLTLAPGEGAFVNSPSAVPVTFTGTPHIPILPVALCPGLNLLSRQTNDIGTYEDIVGLPPNPCVTTKVYRFNPGPGRTLFPLTAPNYTIYTFQNGAWDPQAPTVNVGEAVWIETEAPSVTITTQPASATVVACSSVTFTVAATGNGPLTYQWWFNDQPIAGATSDSYEISSVTSVNAGTYTVAVSDSCSSVASAHALLTVNPSVVISSQPDSATFTECPTPYNVTFTVAATGNGPLTYQWMFNGQPIPAATDASYEIISVSSTDVGAYSVTISDSCSSVTSAVAWLTPGPSVNITGQPASATVTGCSSATFMVTATGNGPLSYQWLVNGQPIPGATDASYEIPIVNSTNAGLYTVRITDSCCTVTSTPALLTVTPTVVISSQPAGATFTECPTPYNVTFSVAATGNGPLTYQWMFNGQPISGATDASYEIIAVNSTDVGGYTVAISDSCSSVTSAPALLTPGPSVIITSQPANATVPACSSSSVTFAVTATGNGPLTYQWLFNGQSTRARPLTRMRFCRPIQ